MQALIKLIVVTLAVMTVPVFAQTVSTPKGGAGPLSLKKSPVVRLEDYASLMVNNSSYGTIKVVYYSGKSDVYIDGPTLVKVLGTIQQPSAWSVFEGPLGITEWVSVKALRELAYEVRFSKLTLEVVIETPVASRLNQEISLKPTATAAKAVRVTHQPALISGVVNVGGVHDIKPDTFNTTFAHGYDINGVLNLNQTLLRFWVVRPAPQTITLGSFYDLEKTVIKASDDWVWNTIALSRTDYNNGVSYMLGDVTQPNSTMLSFPNVWGVAIHSMGRSHLVNSNQRTTETELNVKKRSEVVIEINQRVIQRLVCNAGMYRLVDIPLVPFGNTIRFKIKPLQSNDPETIVSKWVYIDPDILPIGRIESRFQVGVPLIVDLSGRQIDPSVWSMASGVNMGIAHNTMAGGLVVVGNKGTRIGLDMTLVSPIGKLNVMPQFEQYGAYPVGHLQWGISVMDASKEVKRQPFGLSFKSYVFNVPFSDTTTSDLKYSMSNAINATWHWDTALKLDSGVTHLMIQNQHKLIGTFSGTWDWGWIKWGGQWQWKLTDQQWQRNQSIGAWFRVFQANIQVGVYEIDQISGVSASLAWQPIPELAVQTQQGLNNDSVEWRYNVNDSTKWVASQTNRYNDTNANVSIQQLQMNQGNQHESVDWTWSLKKMVPATPTASMPKTPHAISHRVNVSNRRFVGGFNRMDYNDTEPGYSTLSWGSAVVFADGQWAISRPISSGFVMLNVAGAAHLPEVYINKQPYYDALGASVYSQLNPYQLNAIEIEAQSAEGEFLGSSYAKITPLPNQNYVVGLTATPRVTLTFRVKPYHQQRMTGQRVTMKRLHDDADDTLSVLIGAGNQVVLTDVYPGKYELTFSDSRLGRMIVSVSDSVIESKELGLIPLGSQTVSVYAN